MSFDFMNNGPFGPNGPSGPNGPTGPTGPTGSNGSNRFDMFFNSNKSKDKKPKTVRTINFKPKHIYLILIALLVLIEIFTSFFMVNQQEQAVILRFGKYIKTVGPGLHIKIPYGVDRKYIVQTQKVQTMSFGYRTTNPGSFFGTSSAYTYSGYSNESTMLTGDLNIVEVQWIVQYRIEDPYLWLFNVYNNEQTISDISRSVVNQLVGDLPILSVMTSERTAIETDAQVKLQQTLSSYNMGVKIVTVKLQDVIPPKGDVQDAFEDVNKAIQDMNKLINEGKNSYNSVIPAAQGEANRLIQEAEGYASERVNTAVGDVARFESVRNEYNTSKDITKKRLYLETMEEIFSNDQKLTLIDSSLDGVLPFYDIKGGMIKSQKR